MLKRLWLRWQCWRNKICIYCGSRFTFDYYERWHCAPCYERKIQMRRMCGEGLSKQVRAMRGNP